MERFVKLQDQSDQLYQWASKNLCTGHPEFHWTGGLSIGPHLPPANLAGERPQHRHWNKYSESISWRKEMHRLTSKPAGYQDSMLFWTRWELKSPLRHWIHMKFQFRKLVSDSPWNWQRQIYVPGSLFFQAKYLESELCHVGVEPGHLRAMA